MSEISEAIALPELRFNVNVAAMQPSATLAVSARAKVLRREGRPVVSLSAGEPDFDTPAPVSEAAIQAIRDGFTHYTMNTGIPELRQAISEKFARDNGLSYSVDEILCSSGAKQSVALAIFAMCGPGDEVIIPAPYWVSYPEMVRMAGATPVFLPTSVDDDYLLHHDALDAAINPRTRLILLCSPSNPTGGVYSGEQLEAIAGVIQRHEHVFVLSDEIYEYIVYDAAFHAFASFDGMRQRTITVNGFSKGFAMTGWRLGYLAADREIVKAAAKIQGHTTSAPCSITQKAGVAALEMGHGPIQEMVTAFRTRRDFVYNELQSIPGLKCPLPQGAFYLFPDFSYYLGAATLGGDTIETSTDLCLYLLEEYNVALVPGDAFGAPNGIRLSYAASMEDLKVAIDRIGAGLAALQR